MVILKSGDTMESENRVRRLVSMITLIEFKKFRDICRDAEISMSDALRAYIANVVKNKKL